MKTTHIWPMLGFAIMVSGCGIGSFESAKSWLQERWSASNDPLLLNGSYVRNFSQLPINGELRKAPWADTYWATRDGGVAYRWQTSETPFEYKLHTKEEIIAMSANEIGMLSPAEKYDIYNGKFNFPTVISERDRTSPNALGWEGLCHGWAAAAYLFLEPKPVVVTSPTGIKIPFGSSDIKALLIHYVALRSPGPVHFLGVRCNIDLGANPDSIPASCRDVNAGSFHIVLTNQMGILRQSFVADVRRDQQVWNQPIFGFESKVESEKNGASEGAAAGTVKEVTIRTAMHYVNEISASWSDTGSFWNDTISTETYEYRVELNAQGEIIGGEWLSYNRPDFLWIMEKVNFSAQHAGLKNIYETSIAQREVDVNVGVRLDGARNFVAGDLISLPGIVNNPAEVKRIFLWEGNNSVASTYSAIPSGTFMLQLRLPSGAHALKVAGESSLGEYREFGTIKLNVR
jgi:hypothetical protein